MRVWNVHKWKWNYKCGDHTVFRWRFFFHFSCILHLADCFPFRLDAPIRLSDWWKSWPVLSYGFGSCFCSLFIHVVFGVVSTRSHLSSDDKTRIITKIIDYENKKKNRRTQVIEDRKKNENNWQFVCIFFFLCVAHSLLLAGEKTVCCDCDQMSWGNVVVAFVGRSRRRRYCNFGVRFVISMFIRQTTVNVFATFFCFFFFCFAFSFFSRLWSPSSERVLIVVDTFWPRRIIVVTVDDRTNEWISLNYSIMRIWIWIQKQRRNERKKNICKRSRRSELKIGGRDERIAVAPLKSVAGIRWKATTPEHEL